MTRRMRILLASGAAAATGMWTWSTGARAVGATLSAGAIAVAAAVKASIFVVPLRPTLPRPTGPFQVVRRPINLGGTRSGVVFHPTRSGLQRRAAYRAGPLRDDHPLPALLTDHLTGFPIHASAGNERPISKIGAAEATGSESLPWVLHFHGGAGFPEDQTILCSDLASHGHTVVAVDLPLPAAARPLLTASTVDGFRKALAAFERDGFEQWAVDVVDDVLAGRDDDLLPQSDVIVMGHSLGGGLAGAVIAPLTRGGVTVSGWVDLDGEVIGDGSPERDVTPQLHLSQGVLASQFRTPETEQLAIDHELRIAQAIAGCDNAVTWFEFDDAGHMTFTDLPHLIRAVGRLREMVGIGRPLIEPIHRTVRTFIAEPADAIPIPPGARRLHPNPDH